MGSSRRGAVATTPPERSIARAVRRFAARAAAALTPSTSAWLVIGSVAWLLGRPFLHLGGVVAAAVDTVTMLGVFLVAILIEVGRETSGHGKGVRPPASGSTQAA